MVGRQGSNPNRLLDENEMRAFSLQPMAHP
jgi:hypothetical protein